MKSLDKMRQISDCVFFPFITLPICKIKKNADQILEILPFHITVTRNFCLKSNNKFIFDSIWPEPSDMLFSPFMDRFQVNAKRDMIFPFIGYDVLKVYNSHTFCSQTPYVVRTLLSELETDSPVSSSVSWHERRQLNFLSKVSYYYMSVNVYNHTIVEDKKNLFYSIL